MFSQLKNIFEANKLGFRENEMKIMTLPFLSPKMNNMINYKKFCRDFLPSQKIPNSSQNATDSAYMILQESDDNSEIHLTHTKKEVKNAKSQLKVFPAQLLEREPEIQSFLLTPEDLSIFIIYEKNFYRLEASASEKIKNLKEKINRSIICLDPNEYDLYIGKRILSDQFQLGEIRAANTIKLEMKLKNKLSGLNKFLRTGRTTTFKDIYEKAIEEKNLLPMRYNNSDVFRSIMKTKNQNQEEVDPNYLNFLHSHAFSKTISKVIRVNDNLILIVVNSKELYLAEIKLNSNKHEIIITSLPSSGLKSIDFCDASVDGRFFVIANCAGQIEILKKNSNRWETHKNNRDKKNASGFEISDIGILINGGMCLLIVLSFGWMSVYKIEDGFQMLEDIKSEFQGMCMFLLILIYRFC